MQLLSIRKKVDEAHLVKHWPKKLIGLGLNTTLIWTWTFEAAHKNGSQVSVFDLRKGSSKVKCGSQEKYDLGLEEKNTFRLSSSSKWKGLNFNGEKNLVVIV